MNKSPIMIVPLLLIQALAHANDDVQRSVNREVDFYAYGPPTLSCVVEAARKQNFPANILLAVLSIEGGEIGVQVRNTNGTTDISPFQINTIHWSKNETFDRYQISQHDVAWRGCYSAELAAWMLRQHLTGDSDRDFWTRVANYHSKTPKHNVEYRRKLIPYAILWGKWLQKNYAQVYVSQR